MAADAKGQPVHILWDKVSDAGALSGGSWVAGGGVALGNLQTQDVQELSRSNGLSPAATCFRLDYGRMVPQTLFALLNHNGSKRGRRRITVSNDPAGLNPVYDSGWEFLRVRSIVWGVQPFGAGAFDGFDDAAYPAGLLDLHISPQTVYGRYLFYHVDDQLNSDGWFQAGRFLAGAATRLKAAYGLKIRPVDPSIRRRTRGGFVVVRQLPRYREISAEFEHLTEAQAFAEVFEMERKLGKSGDFLLVTDPSDAPAIRYRRVIYASMTETSGLANTSRRRWRWSLAAEELV